jgi:hypothetical protein
LVGGPGNGKTEAVEELIEHLDKELDANGKIISKFRELFAPSDGRPVPRRAEISLAEFSAKLGRSIRLHVVQDASVPDPQIPGRSAAFLLASDLKSFVVDTANDIYIACVNRGVLDDALSAAIAESDDNTRRLLEAVATAVSLSPSAPSCWPLAEYPATAIWPMDVESLLNTTDAEIEKSAAEQLLDVATKEQMWPVVTSCAAGDKCPFCTGRELLSREPYRASLLTVLRLYELATGKRWSFRDLFTLFSYLLAGSANGREAKATTPCEWAAKLASAENSSSARHRAPFVLVASQYQHALFGRWPRAVGRRLRNDLKDLRLDDQSTLVGLQLFLAGTRGFGAPATLAPQLESLCEALDPALADPDEEIEISSRTKITFRDLDTRFSHSVGEGLKFLRKYHCLTQIEIALLQKLEVADQQLSDPDVRRRRPATAARVQRLVRDFACRLTRRSLGVRSAVVRDFAVLTKYKSIVEGDEQLLHEAVRQVESLLNEKDHFVVSLNTTFGESPPPQSRRAILYTAKQKVRPRSQTASGRPVSTLRFLSVGDGSSTQPIPLTYELFRSVRELKRGMLASSLPRTVVALLDTTRARLSGRIVRNEDLLDGSEIHIGTTSDVVVRELGKFIIRKEGET